MTFQRILLTRLRFIGDVVLTTPIIRAVRAAAPHACLAYLADKEAATLLEGNPHLNQIFAYDFSRASVFEQVRMARRLRREHFDLVIDMFNNPRSALLTYATGARVRVGLERSGRGSLYTIQVRDDGQPKTPVAFHNQFLEAAGIPPAMGPTEIFLREEECRAVRSFLPDGAGPLVGIHPGATWPAKRWLPERFAALVDALQRKGYRVVLTMGPRDGEVVRAVLDEVDQPPHVMPVLPLRELAAAIAGFEVFVSNDAGPMHIAAAVGVPTIGLFGPGEENIWFPYEPGLGHQALRKDVPCHPCHKDFCPREGGGYMECMKLLEVTEVLAAVERALGHPIPAKARKE